MKTILLALLFLCQLAHGRNIVLLTSLPEKEHKHALKAERLFLKKTYDFSDEFKILVVHRADQETLFTYLNDPETHALFWLSHGAYLKGGNTEGVKTQTLLLDHNKDNVARVFSKIHPHVKFLGIIGCYSEQIIGGIIQDREDLDYYIPAKKVIGQFALRRAIKHFRWTHYRKDNSLAPVLELPQGPEVTLHRKTGDAAAYKSLKVIVGGELITVLPKMEPRSEGSFSFRLPHKERYTKADLKVVFDSGQNPLDGSESIGELELVLDGRSPWRLFAKASGEPFGTNERIFIFMDKLIGGQL